MFIVGFSLCSQAVSADFFCLVRLIRAAASTCHEMTQDAFDPYKPVVVSDLVTYKAKAAAGTDLKDLTESSCLRRIKEWFKQDGEGLEHPCALYSEE